MICYAASVAEWVECLAVVVQVASSSPVQTRIFSLREAVEFLLWTEKGNGKKILSLFTSI